MATAREPPHTWESQFAHYSESSVSGASQDLRPDRFYLPLRGQAAGVERKGRPDEVGSGQGSGYEPRRPDSPGTGPARSGPGHRAQTRRGAEDSHHQLPLSRLGDPTPGPAAPPVL